MFRDDELTYHATSHRQHFKNCGASDTMATSTISSPTEKHYQPEIAHLAIDQAWAESTSSSYADDILQRIDDTLALIAEAQSTSRGATPQTSFDISIIVPVFNARESLPQVLDRIEEVMPPSCEVIIVDDGSTDGSWHYARSLTSKANFTVLHRRRHHGRGSAIRMGLRHCTGRVVAIQDADMAYDPADLLGAIWPILEDKADAVYGSRRLRRDTRRDISVASRLSGRITTLVANLSTGLRISDMESSHKVFRGDLIRSLDLRECDRGFDAEVTAKIARRAGVVMEVPTTFEGEFLADEFRPRWSTLLQTVRSLVQYRRA